MHTNGTHEPRTAVDVVVVGAGFAGLCALHRMRELGLSVQLLEAGSGVGGVWFWNRYPGARCDVESVDYSYSFSDELEQEWEWTERYPRQPEILRYLNHVADRFKLRDHIRFGTRVTSARYDDATSNWLIDTDDRTSYSATFCIMAAGNLSTLYTPELPGLETFRGKILHTARWPSDDVEMSGRRVGVIGTGSTGIQTIPVLARQAGHVTVFQRTANYSIPAQNRVMSKADFDEIKADYRGRRRLNRRSRSGVNVNRNTESALNVSADDRRREFEARWAYGGSGYFLGAFSDLLYDLDANAHAAEFVRDRIREIVKNPEVAERLTPRDHPIGSKRVCVDTEYFETYNRDNITLVDLRQTPIAEVTPEGIRTGDILHELDYIVFATGFDAITGALFGIDIRGRRGIELKKEWSERPRAYLGIMSSGFPNLFLLTGPGSPSVLSNVVLSIEHHVDFVAGLYEYMTEHGFSEVEPDAGAQGKWMDHVDQVGSLTLYPLAKSWYMGSNIPGKPRIFSLYAGGVDTYQDEVAQIVGAGYEGFLFDADAQLASNR